MKVLKIAVILILVFAVLRVISVIEENQAPGSRASASVATCIVSDIAVNKLRARTDPETGYTRITGLLTNHCVRPAGPQVKITVYDKAGEVLKVDDMWPASVNNIPANADFPFEWVDKVDGFSRFTISVTDARTWGVNE